MIVITSRHRNIIHKVLKSINIPPYLEYQDLVQEGEIELMRVADKYDPSLGQFITYAYRCIRGRIMDCIRKNRSLVKVSREDKNIGSSHLVYIDDPDHTETLETLRAQDTFKDFDDKLFWVVIHNMIKKEIYRFLTLREAMLIMIRYGLVGDGEFIPFKKLEKRFGLAGSTLSGLESTALEKLRKSEKLREIHQTVLKHSST